MLFSSLRSGSLSEAYRGENGVRTLLPREYLTISKDLGRVTKVKAGARTLFVAIMETHSIDLRDLIDAARTDQVPP